MKSDNLNCLVFNLDCSSKSFPIPSRFSKRLSDLTRATACQLPSGRLIGEIVKFKTHLIHYGQATVHLPSAPLLFFLLIARSITKMPQSVSIFPHLKERIQFPTKKHLQFSSPAPRALKNDKKKSAVQLNLFYTFLFRISPPNQHLSLYFLNLPSQKSQIWHCFSVVPQIIGSIKQGNGKIDFIKNN